MRRREFITLLGGAAAWPLAARAQQPTMPVIGFLNSESPAPYARHVAAFRSGLKDGGFVEGQNVAMEFRWAENQLERLPVLAADLVRRRVAVIAATGGSGSIVAAKAATTTIPIVFTTGGDPVSAGFVESLARPGGNVTGASFFSTGLGAKALGLLHQIAPQARIVGLLFNPSTLESARQPTDAQVAARALGLELLVLNATRDEEIDQAFATLLQRRAGVLVIGSDPFFGTRLDRLAELTKRYQIPATYFRREFPAAGGLMGYGSNPLDAYRQAGVYIGRILKGDKPGDLPVTQSTKFEFVLNLKTATALGLTIPPGVLAIADEVIE
jgi:putative ABC transport system substrate-binding protein